MHELNYPFLKSDPCCTMVIPKQGGRHHESVRNAIGGKIFGQVEQGRKGSGGISDRVVIFQGLRYITIEAIIALYLPSGEKVCARFTQGEVSSGICVLFKRDGDKEDHISFVVLDEQDQVITTSEDGATGCIYAAFAREGGKKLFACAISATNDGGNRASEMLLTEEQRGIAFLQLVGRSFQ